MAARVNPAFGRLPAPDERDQRFTMRAATPPVTRTWRMWTPGPVLDQGSEPACVGFAWRQWLASSPVRQKGGPDGMAIYAQAQRRDEWPGEDYAGSSVRGGAKYLQEIGAVTSYVWAWSAADVRDFVLTSGPVVLGTNWYSGMSQAIDGYARPTGYVQGGHAYICIGYSTRRGAFRIMNSWSKSWSQAGRAWIAEEDMETLIKADGEACSAVEQAL